MFISLPYRSDRLPKASDAALRGRVALGLAGGAMMSIMLAGAAFAQTADGSPTAESYRRVASACKADYATFCSASSPRKVTGREQTICLKYHRQDLSLGCRSAVNAATR